MNKIYKCKKNSIIIAITLVMISIAFALVATVFQQIITSESTKEMVGFSVAVFILITVFSIPFLLSPTTLEIASDLMIIKIKFPFHKKIIPIKDVSGIHKAAVIPISTLSTQGYFGFIGITMDNTRTYINDTKNMFLLEYLQHKCILSCENSAELVAWINDLKN